MAHTKSSLHQPKNINYSDVHIDINMTTIEKKSMATYVSDVLYLVNQQLALTSFISIVMYINQKNIINTINNNPLLIWLPLVGTISFLIGLHFNKDDFYRKIFFWGFTACISLTLGLTLLSYSPDIIIKAVLSTFIIVMGIYFYAKDAALKNKDFSNLGPALFGCLIGLIIASILQMFIQSSTFGFIITIAGIFIFIGLLMYDLNRLYNNKYDENPLDAAINIYLDIINLFLYLLKFLKDSE
jgi:FtsH-binding integral membrane protein